MGVVSLLEAIMGTSVDLKGLDTGLEKAERRAEEGAQKIAGHFGLMATTISVAIAGAVLVALEKAIRTTAEWGLEMEHLSNRMGVTTREAATLVGVMERFGVNAQMGARAMQMLSMQVQNTQNSLDPFATRLGRVLGSLRDGSGHAMNMVQVLELVRQKVSTAATDSDKLKIATELLGARIGGQLIPMLKLSNEEWDRQKASVSSTLGPVEKAAEQALAYRNATAALQQSFRGLEVEIGTRLLPEVTKITGYWAKWLESVRETGNVFSLKNFTMAADKMHETELHAAAATTNQEKLADASERVAQEIELTEQNERKIVAAVRERVALEEKALALGMDNNISGAVEQALAQLEEQRRKLESELQQNLTPDQRLRIEAEITKNRIEAVETVRRADAATYKHEEEAIKHMLDLRIVGIDFEIAYRKQKAAEMIGKGDIFGAAGEIAKARDLAVKQEDQVMEFTKKIRIVSLQSEIDYQKEKLELAKGNAEAEMKILGEIADLDKQMYDQRLEFALNYTKKTTDAYMAMMKATGQTADEAGPPGEELTFAQAGRAAERMQFQQARTLRDIAAHGGTAEARNLAIQQAQDVYKDIEGRQKAGTGMSEGLKELGNAARELLRAAAGGEEVRAPGGPSPTIGSLLSPAEGLATATLARGSDIPRLDTSFTDLAVRVRDVLLSATSYVQGFSTALQTAGQKLSSQFGIAFTPGTGPGGGVTSLPTEGSGVLATNQQNLAPATTAPGGTPTASTLQIGIGSLGGSDIAVRLSKLEEAISSGNRELIDALNNTSAANAESLVNALQEVRAARAKVDVTVGVDPSSGEMLTRYLVNEISQ